MQIDNLSTLKIHKFKNKEQYERARANGHVSDTDLCLTPDEEREYSWDNIEDKPFGEVTVMGDTLTWDGKRDGSYDLFIPYMEYFFISDISISQEELFAGEFKSVLSTGEVFEYKYTQQDLYGEPTKSYEYYKNGVAIITNDAPELHDTKPGVYFYYAEIDSKGRECYVTSFTYKDHNVFPTIATKQIDEKYLPDEITALSDQMLFVDVEDNEDVNDPYETIVIDSELSLSSENPVQNKVITNEFNKFGGTVEVTSGEPEKENTAITINPNPESVNIYTAEEVDSKLAQLTREFDAKINAIENGNEVAY